MKTRGKRWRAMYRRLIKRDGFFCHLCFLPLDLLEKNEVITLDHLLPESRGGIHTSWNRALAHERCDSARGNAPLVVARAWISAWKLGLIPKHRLNLALNRWRGDGCQEVPGFQVEHLDQLRRRLVILLRYASRREN
jgi:5-methylcytosine-specific restriction endonuclease McrA